MGQDKDFQCFPETIALVIGQDDWYDLFVDGKRIDYGHSLDLREAGELLVNKLHVTKFHHLFLANRPEDPKLLADHFGELVQDVYRRNDFIEYYFPNTIPDDIWEQLIALK